MLPRLQAEERLKHITDAAAGFGALERRAHAALIRDLKKAAEVEHAKPRPVTSAMLGFVGIAVRTAPPSSGTPNA